MAAALSASFSYSTVLLDNFSCNCTPLLTTKNAKVLSFLGSQPLLTESLMECRKTYRFGRHKPKNDVFRAASFLTSDASDLVNPTTALFSSALLFAGLRGVAYFRLEYIKAAILSRNIPRGGAKVLDLNVSGGRNFYYFPNDVEQVVVALESDSKKGSKEAVKAQAIQAGVPADVRVGKLADLRLLPSSMDAVVSVNALSRIADEKELKAELDAVARVLRTGQPLVFVESSISTNGFLQPAQLAWWAVLKLLGKGDHFKGDIIQLLKENKTFEGIQYDCVVEYQDPHIVGVALKSGFEVPAEEGGKVTKALSKARTGFGKAPY